MKKFSRVLWIVFVFTVFAFPGGAFAQDVEVEAPILKQVQFNNAELLSDFSPSVFEYKIMLDDSGTTPTLKKYEITQGANIFFTDNVSNSEKGIKIEVSKNNISTNYFFAYVYPDSLEVERTNNFLKEFSCELGQVYPELNKTDTTYSLYIPSDLTQLSISAVAESVGAECDAPGLIKLNEEQSPSIKVSVRAMDGNVRVYNFEVKRLEENSQQVLEEIKNDNLIRIIENDIFHKRPEFKIIIVSALCGLVLLVVLVMVIKRFAIKSCDEDEFDFFDYE